MKFFTPLALFALAAGVSAQDPNCEANYILDVCVTTETTKVEACSTIDYDCLCAAHQGVATCYNNCPNDPRIPTVNNQVLVFCQNASLYGDRATRAAAAATAATPSPTKPNVVNAEPTSETEDEDDNNDNENQTSNDDQGNAGANLALNTGAVLLAVAGVVAAAL